MLTARTIDSPREVFLHVCCPHRLHLRDPTPTRKATTKNPASMSTNNNPTHNLTTPPSGNNPPYTITEQDGKIKVVFTSGPQKGDNFEIPRPQTLGTGESSQTKQLEVESSVSYLDGNGNKISEEEFERLSAIEIAEEEAREGGGGVR
jgi:hypothetical protein